MRKLKEILAVPLALALLLPACGAQGPAADSEGGLEQAAEGETIWYDVQMPTDEIAQQLFA